MSQRLYNAAVEILARNDLGHYTVPTHGLYPFQWNWDSALSALGQFHEDEDRGWREIETLFDHQWPDGMVPHIIFHKEDDGYFPGPAVWQTGRPVETTGITQPAVAGFAVRRLFERARNRDMAQSRAAALVPRIAKWHNWFFATRDPHNTGLVAIIHPWESGRDNSIDWDDALARVPVNGVGDFQRRDIDHTDAAHRPTDAQYQRYISLVQHFRSLGWDTQKLHDASPFQVVDPGFNAILFRSCADLAALASALNEPAIAQAAKQQSDRGVAALDSLWSDIHQQYLCYDRITQKPIESRSIGGLLPVFAAIAPDRSTAIAEHLDELAQRCKYMIPSHDTLAKGFDGERYWRGPSWLIMNYMIADGLERDGHTTIAQRIITDSTKLIHESGFAEYYDPLTGAPCGGAHFTWTAAMVIEFLKQTGEVA